MRILTLLLLSLCYSIAYAEEPTFDFKGISLGADFSTVKDHPDFLLNCSSSSLADKECSLVLYAVGTIAGIQVEALSSLFFDDKLHNISISIKQQFFGDVLSALEAKYGHGELQTQDFQNRMGAKFQNRVYVWRRGKSNLTASEYVGTLDKSMIMYYTDHYIKERDNRKATGAGKRAKDL